MKKYTTTLTIAGSDTSGGAGIQADLKTFSALRCYGMSVITALTAQNTKGVQHIHAVTPVFIEQQLNSILDDININAIKIGMLHSDEIIKIVATFAQKCENVPIVLDPVIVAKDESVLLQKDAIFSLVKNLFPVATVITPNISEAEFILQKTISQIEDMPQAAKELSSIGSQAVLLKGGHLGSTESDDCLYIKKENKVYWFKACRIQTKNTHGTGCTLSAAIAAFLAQGSDLTDAIGKAKDYITKAIMAGKDFQLGHGYGPVWHDWMRD